MSAWYKEGLLLAIGGHVTVPASWSTSVGFLSRHERAWRKVLPEMRLRLLMATRQWWSYDLVNR